MAKLNEFVIELSRHSKQFEAFNLLWNQEVKELLFGGGASGGKSRLGCTWLTLNAATYPDTRWLLGRAVLKDLKQSTLLTLFEVFKSFDMAEGREFKYDAQMGVIKVIPTNVEIYLKDLAYYPSDPKFDRVGSTEYTGGFIDEAQEVMQLAKDVVITRMRYKTKEYNLRGQLLMACNPGKNFTYTEFYDPWRKGVLPEGKAFIPALAKDNPFNDPTYIESLAALPEGELKQRLYYGNWDFEDTDNQLVLFGWMQSILTDQYPTEGVRKVGVDVAREGKDRTIISLWIGNTLAAIQEIVVPITDQTDIGGAIADKIIEFCTQHSVGYRDVHIDAVGVGASVVDALRRLGWMIKSYKGGEKVDHTKLPDKITQYANLRAYSYWQFRLAVQGAKIRIYKGVSHLDQMIHEFTAHKYQTNDKLIMIEEKEEVKKILGKSPDISDSVVIGFAPAPKNEFNFAFS